MAKSYIFIDISLYISFNWRNIQFLWYGTKMTSNNTPQTIIGRTAELAILDKIYHSSQSEFLAIYGRKRIGKTYLISEYFKKKGYYFELTGAKDATLKTQLNHFREEFADAFYSGVKQETPNSWQDAFNQLRRKAEHLAPEKKIILFLDELPWLASPRSGFLASLEHVWNRYLSRLNNIILIVCGSAASWMLKKIIYNKGGLHGRLTAEIYLKPFTLGETETYLKAKNINLDRKQIIELYLAFGGVAKYLANISKGKSSAQIIAETCFSPNGALLLEFPKLYDSLFENPQQHISIVNALSGKKSGMTQEEIIKKTGMSSGGNFTRLLNELENSGFILSTPQFSCKKKETKFRLIDEYSIFYLEWIKPALDNHFKNVAQNYWQNIQNSPAFIAWAGYAFEGVCLKHADRIIEALKISVVARSSTVWSYRPKKKNENGTQINLVIDRADKCINLCEIKFCDSIFTVTKNYGKNLQYKKTCFQEQTTTKKSLFTTLITTYGAAINEHYLASVDNQLTMDVLF
jgi:AAA+ ATPase superfamily predicted ATPase